MSQKKSGRERMTSRIKPGKGKEKKRDVHEGSCVFLGGVLNEYVVFNILPSHSWPRRKVDL